MDDGPWSMVYRPSSVQSPNHLLHFTQYLAPLDQILHRVVIVVQRAIHIQMLHMLANDFATTLRPFARVELAKVQRLRRRHELDAKHAVSIVEDLSVFEGSVQAHRNEVLL